MAMNALGRLLNAVPSETTTATWVSFQHSSAMMIWALTATSGNVTVQIAKDSAGTGAVNYDGAAGHGDGITTYYTWASGVWTAVTQAAAATFTCATGGLAVTFVPATGIPDGFKYINASHSTAHLLLMPADLYEQRKPASLVNLTT